MGAKHTSGEWIIDLDNDGPIFISSTTTGERICTIEPEGGLKDENEVDANAALIASAPELLEALRIAREWMGTAMPVHGQQRKLSDAQNIVDKAISKAGA